MAGDSSRILLGLPNLPADTIDPKLWSEFLTVYRAIQNLLLGVSEFSGIDAPDAIEVASMDPTKYLLGANLARWYPTADVAITRGQLVKPNPGASNHCTLADASTGVVNCPAVGIANQTVGAGQKVEVITNGMTDAISGMIPGTLYYLSPTPGAVQNLRPVAAGQAIQPIGWAMSSTQMLLCISSYAHVI